MMVYWKTIRVVSALEVRILINLRFADDIIANAEEEEFQISRISHP